VTNYREMAARGRAEAHERTAGRRKVRAERIETAEVPPVETNIRPLPGVKLLPPARRWRHALIGECGHVLDGPFVSYAEEPPGRWHRAVERRQRMTCFDAACKVERKPEVPDAERCEYVEGVDFERRCPTRARYETDMGRVCRKHRNWYLREGYIDETGVLA
jgi:hypothetical protein